MIGDWVSRTEIERNPVYRMPGMICFDAGRVASGDFYGDAQLTRIEVGGDGVRLIAESPHYCHLVPCLSEPPYANEITSLKLGRVRSKARPYVFLMSPQFIVPCRKATRIEPPNL